MLGVSTTWGLRDARDMAIEMLLNTGIDSVDRVLLGQVHMIPGWIIDGYLDLTSREFPLCDDEGWRLGAVALSRVCRIREAKSKAAYDYLKTNCVHVGVGVRTAPSYDHERHIRELFPAELTQAQAAQAFDESTPPPLIVEPSNIFATPPAQPAPHKHFYMEHVIFLVRFLITCVVRWW